MTDRIPVKGVIVSGAATALAEFEPGDQIANEYLHAQPRSLIGIYAARPAATAVDVGAEYFATDVQELYRSDGSGWITLPASGIVLGAADLGTAFSTTSTSSVDVTGMTTTVTPGTRPLLVSWGGALSMLGGVVSDLFAVTLIQGGAVASQILAYRHPNIITVHREYLVTGLTPNVPVTFSLKANVGTAGTTLNIGGASTDKFYLRVQSA